MYVGYFCAVTDLRIKMILGIEKASLDWLVIEFLAQKFGFGRLAGELTVWYLSVTPRRPREARFHRKQNN